MMNNSGNIACHNSSNRSSGHFHCYNATKMSLVAENLVPGARNSQLKLKLNESVRNRQLLDLLNATNLVISIYRNDHCLMFSSPWSVKHSVEGK